MIKEGKVKIIRLILDCAAEEGLLSEMFKRNLLFSLTLFSVIPSFFVFFTAGKFITTSIDDWFHARISIGLSGAHKLHEVQTQELRQQIKIIGNNINSYLQKNLSQSKTEAPHISSELQKNVTSMAKQPSLPLTAYLWKHDGTSLIDSLHDEVAIWRSYRKLNDRTMKSIKQKFIDRIHHNTIKEMMFDFYGSLYWIKKSNNHFLVLVHRYPPDIRFSLIDIQTSLEDYRNLKSMRNPIYLTYIFTFILVFLLILFLSIWLAFYLAKGLAKPIQELLLATEKIRKGNWDVQVPYDPKNDLKALALAFNEMTKTIKQAHLELAQKNSEMLTILENIKASVFLY